MSAYVNIRNKLLLGVSDFGRATKPQDTKATRLKKASMVGIFSMIISANVTCMRFQKWTTLATGSVAIEHPGPKRATNVRGALRCSIKALIAYASEHYNGNNKNVKKTLRKRWENKKVKEVLEVEHIFISCSLEYSSPVFPNANKVVKHARGR